MQKAVLGGFLGAVLSMVFFAACGAGGDDMSERMAALEAQYAQLSAMVASLTFADLEGTATDAQIPDSITIDEAAHAQSADEADALDGYRANQIPGMLALELQSTVSAVFNQGGGLPSGIAEDDSVTFQLTLDTESASSASPAGSGSGSVWRAAWTFPAVPYTLTYSSGHVERGQIDRMEFDNDGGQVLGDSVVFFDGSTKVYELCIIGTSGTQFLDGGTPPADLQSALQGIDSPGLFDITFMWGYWGNWGTYHYDYTKRSWAVVGAQPSCRATRSSPRPPSPASCRQRTSPSAAQTGHPPRAARATTPDYLRKRARGLLPAKRTNLVEEPRRAQRMSRRRTDSKQTAATTATIRRAAPVPGAGT